MSRSLPLRKEIKHANKHNFSYSKITVTSVDNAHVRNFPPLTYGIHSVRPEIGTSGLKKYWLFHAVDWARTVAKQTIKVPLTLLVDNGSLLYALVNVFHPDWLIRRTSGYAGVTICIKIITNPQVKMKNTRAMLAKSLSLIDEYANL